MSSINPTALSAFKALKPTNGQELTDSEKVKKPNNGVSSFEFFRKDGAGRVSPAIMTEYDPGVTDPSPVSQYFSASGLNSAAKLEKALDDAMAKHKGHLFPKESDFPNFKTKAQFNYVVGARVAQFLKEAEAAAKGLSGAEKTKAGKVIDDIDRELWERNVDLNEGSDLRMTTYGPYDTPQYRFWSTKVQKYDAMLEADDAMGNRMLTTTQRRSIELSKKQAQNQVDDVMRNRAVAKTRSFNSADGEYQKGHALIDAESRQRISVDPAAVQGGKLKVPNASPRYVIMNVTEGGEDKAVYWDHKEDKYFFDGTTQRLTQAQVNNIRISKLPSQAEMTDRITARPNEGNEHLRRDFPFDQTREREISKRVISWLGWAGLCHNQALSESNGAVVPKSHPGHTEYVAEADREFSYNKDTLNNPFLEIPDLGSVLSTGGRRKDLGESGYGGYRRNEEPGRISFGRLTIPRDSRRRGALSFSSVTKPDGTKVSSAEYFREKFAVNKDPSKPDALKSEANPNYLRTTSGDSVECRLTDCIIEAGAQFESYGTDGYMKRDSGRITLDFKNKPDVDVMVDSYRTSRGNMAWEEVYVNLAKGTVTREQFRMERGANGQYTKKNLGKRTSNFSLNGVKGTREAQIDDPSSYTPLVEKSRRTGEAIVFESADNYEIWNSYLHGIDNRTLHVDDDNVTTRYGFESKFGAGHAKIVYDRTASGGRKNHTGVSQKGDFFWSGKHRFLAFDGDYANAGALERGLIHRVNGVVQAPMLNDMCEVMLGAFRDAPYSIVKGGVRHFYSKKSDYEAAKAALKQAYAAIGQAGGGGGGGNTGGVGEIHRSEGSVGRSKFKVIKLPKAEADGEMTIRLLTKSGDADLYVRKGGRPTGNTNDGESENWGLDVDEVKLNVKKGEEVQVRVQGYEASDYQLVVNGPKASGGNTGGGARPVDFTASEALAKDAEKTHSIKVEKDGYLKFKMDGTGDIDIYAKKNGTPVKSTRGNDWHDRGSTSDAEGRLLVKAGDTVNVLLHAWNAGQYNLRITQE